jgi:hypothetical protein
LGLLIAALVELMREIRGYMANTALEHLGALGILVFTSDMLESA